MSSDQRSRLTRFAVWFVLWYLCVRLVFGWILPHLEGLPRWALYLGISGSIFSVWSVFHAFTLRHSGVARFPPVAHRYAQQRRRALVSFPIAAALVIWAGIENHKQAIAVEQPKQLPALYVPSTLASDGFTRLALNARWSDGRMHYTLHSSCGKSHCFPNDVVMIRFQNREGGSLADTSVLIPKAIYSGSVPMRRLEFAALSSWTPSIRNAWVRSEAVCADGVTVSSTRDDACAKRGGVSRWRTLADEYGRTFIP